MPVSLLMRYTIESSRQFTINELIFLSHSTPPTHPSCLLVPLFFEDRDGYSLSLLSRVLSDEFSREEFTENARKNRVLIRSFSKINEWLSDTTYKTSVIKTYVDSILAAEEQRTRRNIALASTIANKFEQKDVEYVIMKTLDNYPDLGRDIDFLIADNFEKATNIVKEEFPQGRSLKNTLCDSLVGKFSYGIPGFDVSIELYPKISQLGEEYLAAQDIIARRTERYVNKCVFYATSPEDQLLITCIHRLYRHGIIRFSDLYNVYTLLRNEKLDWEYILDVAKKAGIMQGLVYFLNLVLSMQMTSSCDNALNLTLSEFALKKYNRIFAASEIDVSSLGIPYKPPSSVMAFLIAAKFGSDFVSFRTSSALWMLMFPPMLALAYVAYKLFRRNLIW